MQDNRTAFMKDERKIIVFDLDGTLAIIGDRLKYLQQGKKTNDSYNLFYDSVGEDTVNEVVKSMLWAIRRMGEYKTIIVTGRPERCRLQTLKWLDFNNMYFDSCDVFMRPNEPVNNHAADTVVKENLCRPFMDRIFAVFEDRDRMVAFWRSKGIVCFQVAKGTY